MGTSKTFREAMFHPTLLNRRLAVLYFNADAVMEVLCVVLLNYHHGNYYFFN